MKSKLLILITLFFLSGNLVADYIGDYCGFMGDDQVAQEDKEKEFTRLLNLDDQANYAMICDIVGFVALAEQKDIQNPQCKISIYAEKLVAWYDKNKQALEAAPNKHIISLLENIKKTLLNKLSANVEEKEEL